jgi:hypothetical protein
MCSPTAHHWLEPGRYRRHLQNRICSGEVPRASRTSRRYLLVARTSQEPFQNLEVQIEPSLIQISNSFC